MHGINLLPRQGPVQWERVLKLLRGFHSCILQNNSVLLPLSMHCKFRVFLACKLIMRLQIQRMQPMELQARINKNFLQAISCAPHVRVLHAELPIHECDHRDLLPNWLTELEAIASQ